jgi:hypothetical protein
MILIEEINIETCIVRFYDGIDFDMIRDHKKEEFLIFFIDNWIDSYTQWERDKKIESLLNDTNDDFNPSAIENKWISIYQTSGNLEMTYLTIKSKLLERNSTIEPWRNLA